MRKKRLPRWSYTSGQRLAEAPVFIAGYSGRDILLGYRNWFKVDHLVAKEELTACGVILPRPAILPPPPADYVPKVVTPKPTQPKKPPAKKKRSKKSNQSEYERYFPDSNETFAFIAGYTSGGAPYGTTWEEMREIEEQERLRNTYSEFDASDKFQIAALRAETVVEQDGKIDVPGIRRGDHVEVIVLITHRPRHRPSDRVVTDPIDDFDPLTDT